MLKLIFILFKDMYGNYLNRKVEKYWRKYKFSMEPNHTSYNNEGGAFKNAFMGADLTLLLGENVTRKLCLIKEEDTDSRERYMNLYNNEWGIKLGLEILESETSAKDVLREKDVIAQEVVKALRSGKLITNM